MAFDLSLNRRSSLILLLLLTVVQGLGGQGATAAPLAAYDPLAVPANFTAQTLDLQVQDEARQRAIPLRVYLGPAKTPAPVVLFSHGLGGSRENDAFLGQHWAVRGYVAVFLQHAGSDEGIWRGKSVLQIMTAMKQAASAENLRLRVQDVHVVLDQLERWNQDAKHPLYQRLDTSKVGMSGHSFGAVTTQAVSGESFPIVGTSFSDTRIKAACMFSPSSPAKTGRVAQTDTAQQAFGSVKIPWLLMTGTKDSSPRQGIDLESRLAVFPALPPGNKYEVVLEGAQHSAFGSRALPGEGAIGNGQTTRNPNHHRVMLALTTAFWDTYLRGDAAAKNWLDGQGAASVFEKGDRWSKK